MNKLVKKVAVSVLAATALFTTSISSVSATSSLGGEAYLSIGSTVLQDTNSYTNTVNMLAGQDVPNNKRVVVDGDMVNRYLQDGSNSSTAVWSSAKVQFNKELTGVNVNIVTPNTITLVRPETYRNAAITAGITNATITVAAQQQVTGEGALVGIYAIMAAKGVLDNQAVSLAQKEIQLVQTAQTQQVEPTVMNAVMTDVKAEVAQAVQNGDIVNGDKIVNNVTNNYGVQLTPELLAGLVDFANNFGKTTVANNPETVQQLGQLSQDLFAQGGQALQGLSSKAQELANDPEFRAQAKNFLSKLWDAIVAVVKWVVGLIAEMMSDSNNGLQTVETYQQ